MISEEKNHDWFYRVLEIRKYPESASQEEILKLADDFVWSSMGCSAERRIAEFAQDKASEYTLNKSND